MKYSVLTNTSVPRLLKATQELHARYGHRRPISVQNTPSLIPIPSYTHVLPVHLLKIQSNFNSAITPPSSQCSHTFTFYDYNFVRIYLFHAHYMPRTSRSAPTDRPDNIMVHS